MDDENNFRESNILRRFKEGEAVLPDDKKSLDKYYFSSKNSVIGFINYQTYLNILKEEKYYNNKVIFKNIFNYFDEKISINVIKNIF